MFSLPEHFREKFQAPVIKAIEPFHFPVDGGGRYLIQDLIRDRSLKLMVEIGCFLCGSTRQWLEASPDILVIGIDPWEGQWHLTLERYDGMPAFEPSFARIKDRKKFIASVMKHGSYTSAMANIQPYRDRFFPVRGKSPEKLYLLHEMGVKPDIVYFDSNKILDDLAIAEKLFPGTILCGDDWSWGRDEGLPVQRRVNAYCAENGYRVTAKGATWYLEKVLDGSS